MLPWTLEPDRSSQSALEKDEQVNDHRLPLIDQDS